MRAIQTPIFISGGKPSNLLPNFHLGNVPFFSLLVKRIFTLTYIFLKKLIQQNDMTETIIITWAQWDHRYCDQSACEWHVIPTNEEWSGKTNIWKLPRSTTAPPGGGEAWNSCFSQPDLSTYTNWRSSLQFVFCVSDQEIKKASWGLWGQG